MYIHDAETEKTKQLVLRAFEKRGNGQGIRIPKLVLQELNIAVNDTLSMEVRGEQIIIEKVKFKHRSLEERARAYGGKLGPYTEYDWGEPKGREIW